MLPSAPAFWPASRRESSQRSLQELLADHEGADPLCRHGDGYGTVCSTILTLRAGTVGRYLFAPGAPCTTPFSPVQRAEAAGQLGAHDPVAQFSGFRAVPEG